MTGVTIGPATSADLRAIELLLADNKLPIDGIGETLSSAVVARAAGRTIGCAALEIYPTGVLLRSVAVDDEWRGKGIGRQLTDAALVLARGKGATAAYLLTTTAEKFFPQFGFAPIERAHVPEEVKQSVEFRSACPSSATVMRAYLGEA